MEAITILGGIKLLIDLFEENWIGVATGILLPPPINEIYTLGDSIYYLFDVNGNRIGTKDINGIRQINESEISLINKKEVLIGFKKAKKNVRFESNNNDIGFNKI